MHLFFKSIFCRYERSSSFSISGWKTTKIIYANRQSIKMKQHIKIVISCQRWIQRQKKTETWHSGRQSERQWKEHGWKGGYNAAKFLFLISVNGFQVTENIYYKIKILGQ